jgi:hypothetical protein
VTSPAGLARRIGAAIAILVTLSTAAAADGAMSLGYGRDDF